MRITIPKTTTIIIIIIIKRHDLHGLLILGNSRKSSKLPVPGDCKNSTDMNILADMYSRSMTSRLDLGHLLVLVVPFIMPINAYMLMDSLTLTGYDQSLCRMTACLVSMGPPVASGCPHHASSNCPKGPTQPR
jgi:hypothetical protein